MIGRQFKIANVLHNEPKLAVEARQKRYRPCTYFFLINMSPFTHMTLSVASSHRLISFKAEARGSYCA